jgi:galactose oxidase
MNWYNPNNRGSTTPAGLRGDDADAMNGNAVMYDAVAGKIFTAGGAPDYQVSSVLRLRVRVRLMGRVGIRVTTKLRALKASCP